MLDTETKRRIDTARDILVGKVPDPKSQVEQITIALIYKFMDDMDAEAVELGGKRKFFKGEFAAYGWAELMKKAGNEKLRCYADGITRMTENEGLPALFRDIFKNAYLPYRDPETLNAFLKIIDEFRYDHSERLGDAFEYLLSVLGSQGDAGQFRTPRHIIDFMVEILTPQKHETVLDPACGTAGFLISAYKHILKTNRNAKGQSTLTPDDKGKLAKNFKGYDISPDMVRLSLVNLYLHGFTDPHIYEYDSLTQDERWNELADVILANPPFMSPKGGIRPHKRFSIQAKRSEVLFVDYMAEHLTPQGRAGIIVPEGIIFQSQTAYVELRKMLVDTCLVAVISLPAGCFNPYSGVKTSILLLDKALAKQSDTIAFFKVENDGFGLGAQRRAIEANDLPQVQTEVEAYLEALRGARALLPASSNSGQECPLSLSTGLIVPKTQVAANGDYNLSGERYREGGVRTAAFPLRRFEEVCTLEYGASLPKEKRVEGPYPVVGSNGITGYHKEYLVEGPAIVVGRKGSAGEVTFIEQNCFPIDTTYYVKQTNPAESNIRFLYWLLKTLNLPELRGGAGIPGLNRTDVYETHQIPLPPLEVQKEVVAEIEGYQKVIDGARAVLDHYRPHIPIHPDWPMVPIKDAAAVESGFGFPLDYQGKADQEIPFLKVSDMNLPGNETRIGFWNNTVSRAVLKELKAKAFPKGTVIFPKIGAAIATNKKRILTRDSTYDNNVMGIVPEVEKLHPDFLHTYLLSFDLSSWASDSQPPSMRKTTVEAHAIPLPPLETQRAIVTEIEAEQALVAANRELITRMEAKIQATLARVWGEEASQA